LRAGYGCDVNREGCVHRTFVDRQQGDAQVRASFMGGGTKVKVSL
jgi:hypothetical protein